MPKNGSATLDDLQFSGLEKLSVSCPKCSREGQYSVQQLIGDYGFEYSLTGFLHKVTEDCPRRIAGAFADQCAAYFPQLKRVD